MSAIATAAAVAVSLAGIGRLAATDPKRRRSFGLPPFRGNRQVTLALTAVFLPPVLLLAIGTGADFVAWLGAISVAGWAVAAVSPRHPGRIAQWLGATGSRVRLGLRALRDGMRHGMLARRRRPDDELLQRIAALEQRLEALEAGLAAAPPPYGDERRIARLQDFQLPRAADA